MDSPELQEHIAKYDAKIAAIDKARARSDMRTHLAKSIHPMTLLCKKGVKSHFKITVFNQFVTCGNCLTMMEQCST